MAQIKLMHAKLHRVRLTEANVNYIGSITIDKNLMDKVGILPLEAVDVIDLNNGKRWTTYAIAGTAGSGKVCSNGGAALLCKPGDILIIIAYEICDRAKIAETGHHAKVLIADEKNRCQKFIRQTLTPNNGKIEFESF